MSEQPKTLLQAAWVAPMVEPPIRDGAILFADAKILAVGPAKQLSADHPDAATRLDAVLSDFGPFAVTVLGHGEQRAAGLDDLHGHDVVVLAETDPAHPEGVPVHYDHLFALLDGYESVRALSREESLAVAPMTALCHAEFALSETDYFLKVLHFEDKARMACEGYLVSHARWFRGAGRKLLDALRSWAETRDGSPRRTSR